MIAHLKALAKRLTSKRSPKWPALEHATRAKVGACEACDNKDKLQVHHCKPFHLHPELELDPANLIVLCEVPGRDCHLNIGHGGNFSAYNPNVRQDAAKLRASLLGTGIDMALRAQLIVSAKAGRLFE